MFRFVLPVLWVVLLSGIVRPAEAQQADPPKGALRDNVPNPFFPATTIPFVINEEACRRDHKPVVSLRVYNVLVQVVGVPVLRSGNDEPLEDLPLDCGEHVAWWDGMLLDGREVTSGVYYYQLLIDGERVSTRKMIVRKEVRTDRSAGGGG